MDSVMTVASPLPEGISERIAEVGALLATGLQRLLARQSSGESQNVGESSLHISPVQSGHVAEIEGGEAE